MLGFAVAAGIWWIYFDITAPSSARELQDVEEEEDAESSSDAGDTDSHVSDVRHDLFVYGHLPLTFGIVLAGVGLEELIVHRTRRLPRSPAGCSPQGSPSFWPGWPW